MFLNPQDITREDRHVLRDLARRVAEVAEWPIMALRRELWKRHNAMERVRPVIYVDPQGSWCELIPESVLLCQDANPRAIELALRQRIYVAEHFASDNVIEKEWVVRKVVRDSGWGLEPRRASSPRHRGAFGFDPVILRPDDLTKLRFPDLDYDAKATETRLAFFQDLFGDILNVTLKGVDHLSYHLMNQYTALRGLEQALMDMVENPQMVHDAMALLEEGHHYLLRQYVEQNLLSLNNDNTPIYTSGHGYTEQLPRPGRCVSLVLPEDLWAWAEAQEMAVVSPDMHAKFVFPYEKRLLEPFGLTGYGCCDDLTRKLDFVLTIPNLRRVSISPWADIDCCAQRLQDRVIFMWKPHPAHLAGEFNPVMIRRYLQHTVEAAHDNNCVLEIVLLDTHTCDQHPERFDEWTRIAHEVAST